MAKLLRGVSLVGAALVLAACSCRPRAQTESATAQVAAPQPLTSAEIYRRSVDAVVRVETPSGVGTGFVVHPSGAVVTHYEIVDQERQARVILPDGKARAVTRVLANDAEHGLAVLSVEGPPLAGLRLADRFDATVGDSILALGNGLGMVTPTLSEGVIGSVQRVDGEGPVHVSMVLLPGFTGAPVLDAQGRVIAILGADAGIGAAIPVSDLAPLLVKTTSASGETIGAFGDRTRSAAGHKSVRPALEESALAECSMASRARVWAEMQSALEIGAPIYALGAHEAMHRVLESAVLRLQHEVQDCDTLLDVLQTAAAQSQHRRTPSEGVEELLETYEAVLDLMFATRIAVPTI